MKEQDIEDIENMPLYQPKTFDEIVRIAKENMALFERHNLTKKEMFNVGNMVINHLLPLSDIDKRD